MARLHVVDEGLRVFGVGCCHVVLRRRLALIGKSQLLRQVFELGTVEERAFVWSVFLGELGDGLVRRRLNGDAGDALHVASEIRVLLKALGEFSLDLLNLGVG